MMLVGAYQRVAQCHEILGDASREVTTYKTIVKNATDALVKHAITTQALSRQ
jgi:hypothetical protein